MLITFCFEFNGVEVDWEYDVDYSVDDMLNYIIKSFDTVEECFEFLKKKNLFKDDDDIKHIDLNKYDRNDVSKFIHDLDRFDYIEIYDVKEEINEEDGDFEDYLEEEYYEEAKDDYFENESDYYDPF